MPLNENKVTNASVTEITGNKRVVLDGCDGLLDFNDELVILKSGKLKIKIDGKNLKISVFTDDTAVIDGYISSVNFNYF